MRYLPFFLLIFFCSCKKEGNIRCTEQDCTILNDFSVKVDREDEAVNLKFAITKIIDAPGKVCTPDVVDFYISEDNLNFDKVDRVSADASNFRINDLENDKFYFLKMVNLHCELDSIVSQTLAIKPGENNLPILTNKSFPFLIDEYEISNDGQYVAYQLALERSWHITSFANPQLGLYLFDQSNDVAWLNDNSRIAYVKLILEDNFVRSHKINIYDLSSYQEITLHTIPNPELYWIHSIETSLDGTSIFFKSNKDNGGSTPQERRIYDNIWKINIETGELEQLSDFLPVDFDLYSFKEDPLNPNSFYVLGGAYNDFSSERRTDLYYFNTTNQTLSPILEDEFRELDLVISPSGDKILLSSQRTGVSELWVYNINTSNLNQITDRHLYGNNVTWSNVFWKDNNTLATHIKFNEEWQFVEFDVE